MLCKNQVPEFFRPVSAVCMGDADGFADIRPPAGFHAGHLGLHGLFGSPGFFGHFQGAVLYDVQERLYLQQGSDSRSGRRDSAASLQVFQRIHGKPVAAVIFIVFHKLNQLFDVVPLHLLLGAEADEHALSAGGAAGVGTEDLPVGEFFPKLVGDHLGVPETSREGGGEAQIEDILSFGKISTEAFLIDQRVDLGGAGALAAPQCAVKIGNGQVAAGTVGKALLVENDFHGNDINEWKIPEKVSGQVSRCIGNNLIAHVFSCSCLRYATCVYYDMSVPKLQWTNTGKICCFWRRNPGTL